MSQPAAGTSVSRDRVCVVTGATRGIGRATAIALAKLGEQVVVVGRDAARLDEVRREADRAAHADLSCVRADFASLASVRRAADEIAQRWPAIHVLVNNAGINAGRRQLSADGFELTFAVNHLAPFLLTSLLTPALASGAPSRVVNVTSVFAHVGVLQELEANNIPVDRLAGVSVGAVAATIYASGMDGHELADRLYTEFVRRNPFNDWRLPTHSLAGGHRVRAGLERAFGRDTVLEGLPRQMHAVSTDLVSRSRVTHRRGLLVDATLASARLPVLFAPLPDVDGHLLVDGGVLDNLPTDLLTERDEGPVVAVNIAMGGGGGSGRARTGAPRRRSRLRLTATLRAQLILKLANAVLKLFVLAGQLTQPVLELLDAQFRVALRGRRILRECGCRQSDHRGGRHHFQSKVHCCTKIGCGYRHPEQLPIMTRRTQARRIAVTTRFTMPIVRCAATAVIGR